MIFWLIWKTEEEEEEEEEKEKEKKDEEDENWRSMVVDGGSSDPS